MSTPREELAELLKKSREDAGHATQTAFARHAHVSRSVISRAENPDQPVPTPEVLERYAGETDADLAELEDLAKRAEGGTPEWFVPYKQAEAEATTIRLWGPTILPGLVQTEAYAREVIAVSVKSPGRLAELVAVRMERQKVIGNVRLIAVISARALQTEIGSPAIMAEQCAHLVALADQQDITIHVVTEENTGAWAILDIASHGSVITVCLSTALTDVTSTAPETVDLGLAEFERVLGLALSPAASLDFLRNREAEWKSQI